jgi:hypothetical protein
MNDCVCKASVLIEGNKEINCTHNIHNCICEYNYIKCMSERHKCICKTHIISTNDCKSNEHYCICRNTVSSNCRTVNTFNIRINCYIKEHECICYKSNKCLSPAHLCICKDMPFRCKGTGKHVCSCKSDSMRCKAIKHKKICFIIRFFRRFKSKFVKKTESSYNKIK